MICMTQLPITDMKAKRPLRFTFTYFQSVTQHYKQGHFAINLVTMENMDDSCLQTGSCALHYRELIPWTKNITKNILLIIGFGN